MRIQAIEWIYCYDQLTGCLYSIHVAERVFAYRQCSEQARSVSAIGQGSSGLQYSQPVRHREYLAILKISHETLARIGYGYSWAGVNWSQS
jgi:hypothetical protein